jgi:hypothetical protein
MVKTKAFGSASFRAYASTLISLQHGTLMRCIKK